MEKILISKKKLYILVIGFSVLIGFLFPLLGLSIYRVDFKLIVFVISCCALFFMLSVFFKLESKSRNDKKE